ncbi:dihydrofolate reductase family protein [Endozoicomonas ascidiicola]|uniref:dihydrofolate reductase family protein n=1 Tax=Endozoicomonas ascidiicola TaxID=1698521 RepID=UPI000830C443|nr:dihydrofolate reductase family protein [Endozoicomonas ascidiicola]
MANIVYIAQSLDGYIADSDGNLDWLNQIPNPENDDYGFSVFMNRIDALLMGRKTYETVIGFDVPWPYEKPVFVISTSMLTSVPAELHDKVCHICSPIEEAIESLHSKGFKNLYIDGGQTIQSLLAKDLIDELILTDIPVILGSGTRLFGEQFGESNKRLWLENIETKVLNNQLVQRHYLRKREA